MSVNPLIIFEDDFLVVIDKPAGTVVNRADTTVKVETVQGWAETKVHSSQFIVHSQIDKEFVDRGGVVHRLDKDTSGLLVIAKTPGAFENLKGQFKGREVVKKYWALVHGEVEPSEGTIDAPIGRSPFNRMHFGVFPGGRAAVTEFRVLKYLKLLKKLKLDGDTFSLLEVRPLTGRTHQIRVHMKYIGHPVVSDPLYVGRKQLRDDLKWCPRLFLHAYSLSITNPISGKTQPFEAPLPPELERVLQRLEESG